MQILTIAQICIVAAGISPGDSGNGVGYYATPSQMESGVTAQQSINASGGDAIVNFFAGIVSGL